MKSIVKISKEKNKYPILKRNSFSGLVILFTEENTGVVVHTDAPHRNQIGEYSNEWSEINFGEFSGTVELCN